MTATVSTLPTCSTARVQAAEITAADFGTVLRRAALFASTEETLPMLTGVQVWVDGGRLFAAATDRYTLGVAHAPLYSRKGADGDRVPIPTGSSGDPLLLPIEDVKRALALFRPTRSDASLPLAIAFPEAPTDDVGASLGGGVVTVTDRTGTRFAFHTYKGTAPPFRALLDLAQHDQAAGPRADIALNPTMLARFAQVDPGSRGGMRIRYPAKETKPLAVSIGEDFLGLIMPIRIPTTDPRGNALPDPWAPWVELLGLQP